MRIEFGTRPERLRDMPAGLFYCLMVCGGFAAVASLFLLLAPFNIGSYSVNAEPVSGPEFLRRAGPLILSLDLLACAAVLGLLRRRPWTRWAVLMLPVVVLSVGGSAAFAAGQPPLASDAVLAGLILIGLWSYLFKSNSVRQYLTPPNPVRPSTL